MSPPARGSVIMALLVALAAGGARADPGDIAGRWRTVDDRSGAPRAIVRIAPQGDAFGGWIERLLDPHDDPTATCVACTGARRDQPIVGLEILTGLKPAQPGTWGGGEIVDPDDGRVYRVKVALRDAGRRLDVRGFVGVSVFGRTQTWERVD